MENKPIVLLTSGIYQDLDGRWKSDFDGHVRYAAAAQLYKESGGLAKIVICGGKINGEENPILSEVMKRELANRYNIPKSNIYTETKSVDTSENAKFCENLFDENGLEKGAYLVTNGYHLRRSAHLFKKYNFKVKKKAAEDILEKRSRNHSSLMKNFRRSAPYAKKIFLNKILNGLLYLPYRVGEKIVRNHIHREIDREGRRKNF